MKPILVVYATREGHTRFIAERFADAARARQLVADLKDAQELLEPVDMSGYSAAVLAASIHAGTHEREISQFVKRYRNDLDAIPTAFLSVSLSEAGAENPDSTPEQRNDAARAVERMMEEFFADTDWHPDRAEGVAGALMYSKYNLFVRWVMKRIAAKQGGSTDTSRDHVYTDWDALDRFAGEFLGSVRAEAAEAAAAP